MTIVSDVAFTSLHEGETVFELTTGRLVEIFLFRTLSQGTFTQHSFRVGTPKFQHADQPCIRLAGGKVKLTNQDSSDGNKFTVLTSM